MAPPLTGKSLILHPPTDSSPGTDWYRFPAEHAAARLGTEPGSGLTDSEARKRLDRYGPNVVADRGGRSAWRVLLAQFTGVLTLVLCAAAVLSVFLGDCARRGRHPGDRRAQRRARVLPGASGRAVHGGAEADGGARGASPPRWPGPGDLGPRLWCRATWCCSRPATSYRRTRACCRAPRCACRKRR